MSSECCDEATDILSKHLLKILLAFLNREKFIIKLQRNDELHLFQYLLQNTGKSCFKKV